MFLKWDEEMKRKLYILIIISTLGAMLIPGGSSVKAATTQASSDGVMKPVPMFYRAIRMIRESVT